MDKILIDPTDLMASSDVADLLGVGYAAVSNWKNRHEDFPEPVARVAGGKTDLYLRSEIIAWFRKRHPALVAALTDPNA